MIFTDPRQKILYTKEKLDRLSALQVWSERPLGIAEPLGSSQKSGVPAHNNSGTPNGFTADPTSLSNDVRPMTHGSGGESQNKKSPEKPGSFYFWTVNCS